MSDDDFADNMVSFKDGTEALEALAVQFSEENARDIAACHELGLMWQRDQYLSAFCHVVGRTVGTIGADMRVGVVVTRDAMKALVRDQSPTDFVLAVLATHPDGADPRVQREVLGLAEVTVFCLQKIAATVPDATREAALDRFIETLAKGIEFMMRDDAPTTH
jgi:hypothetical protein